MTSDLLIVGETLCALSPLIALGPGASYVRWKCMNNVIIRDTKVNTNLASEN